MNLGDEMLARTHGGELVVTLRLRLPPEQPGTPPLRFAVLPIVPFAQGSEARYVVVDRAVSRMVDGVYGVRQMALDAAAHYNAQGGAPSDRAPNAAALGLLFPPPTPREARR